MFNTVLILCHGNICRSPAAEYLLKALLKHKAMTIHSAGLAALVGHAADSHMQEMMVDKDINLTKHKARQVTTSMIQQADLVLVMEQQQIEAVTQLSLSARGKTKLLTQWTTGFDVPDPFKRSQEVTELSRDAIIQGCMAWVDYLD